MGLKNRRLLILFFAIFMVLACSLPQRLLSTQQPQSPASSSTLTLLPSLSLSPTDIILEPSETPEPESILDWHLIQRERLADKPNLNFSMTVQFPYLEGSDHEYVAWFNTIMDSIVQTEIDEMDAWVADAPPPDGIGMFSEIYFSLPTALVWDADEDFAEILANTGRMDAEDVVMNAGHDVLSVLFVNFFYLGGAHPGSYHWSLNYDFTTGQELSLGDLFVPGSAYLERIAEYCSEQLRQHLEFDIWEDGAAPTSENYQVWTITSGGLLIIFDEYQVAPYAAGPQQVIVPYDILTDIIHPQGPIARFVGE